MYFSTHNMLQLKKLPSYGIPALLKKTKTKNGKVNRMGKPYSIWQEYSYHHLPDTTLPVSQGRPCVRWWPSRRCSGHLESHSGRTGLKPLVMQPVQRRSEIKILEVFRIISTHFTFTGNRSIYQYSRLIILFVISGSSRDVDEICVLLQYYAALKMGSIGCPETSVWNFHSTLCNIPKVRISHLHFTGK